MAFRKEMKQLCRTCKGTGTGKKQVVKNGRLVFADIYERGEAQRPLLEDCRECKGTGFTMQPSPADILIDGERVKLEPAELKERYNVVTN